jgi:hypothetical protein
VNCRIACLLDWKEEVPPSRALYAQRKLARLCVTCGNPAAEERIYCLPHLEMHRRDAKRRKEKRRSLGLCVRCGKPKASSLLLACESCRENERAKHGAKARSQRYRDALRDEVYAAYGGYECACCGEKERMFLTLDHIKNDGAAHRKEIFGKRGQNNTPQFHKWLKNHAFPEIVQVLCYNCNAGRHRNGGVCPHKERQ